MSALRPYHRSNSIEEVSGIGVNTGHTLVVDKLLVVSLFYRNNTRQWPLEQMSSGAELITHCIEHHSELILLWSSALTGGWQSALHIPISRQTKQLLTLAIPVANGKEYVIVRHSSSANLKLRTLLLPVLSSILPIVES